MPLRAYVFASLLVSSVAFADSLSFTLYNTSGFTLEVNGYNKEGTNLLKTATCAADETCVFSAWPDNTNYLVLNNNPNGFIGIAKTIDPGPSLNGNSIACYTSWIPWSYDCDF